MDSWCACRALARLDQTRDQVARLEHGSIGVPIAMHEA